METTSTEHCDGTSPLKLKHFEILRKQFCIVCDAVRVCVCGCGFVLSWPSISTEYDGILNKDSIDSLHGRIRSVY